MREPQLSLAHSTRRARKQRQIQRAIRKYSWGFPDMEIEMQNWARKNAEHLRACSCYLCCHNRRALGLTMQEQRSLMALTDDF